MSVPKITGVELAGHADLPLLVVGPSLGTGVTALWGPVAAALSEEFHVIGWNLPGHEGAPVGEGFTMAELAEGVAGYVAGVRAARGSDEPFVYAGDSVGGAVGLQLLLEHADTVAAAALMCTGAKIGEPAGWIERAATVRASGTPVMVTGSAARWFAPGFIERSSEVATRLLATLQAADAEGYAQVCEALAGFDVRGRLPEISQPVLAVAGAFDEATNPRVLHEIAAGVADGRLEVLGHVAHLAPAEDPARCVELIRTLRVGAGAGAVAGSGHNTGYDTGYEAGKTVRRAVLGDEHVDRANASITDVNRAYQDLITRYAWGDIWTRPGLARRDRSIGVLTALIAGRHFEELEFHLRAALRNGLTRDEIIEVLLQTAIYVGVPAANSAFAVANRVLGE